LPHFCFFGDQPAKFKGGAYKRECAELGKPRLQLRIGDARTDLLV
jgi:hypothetical protein